MRTTYNYRQQFVFINPPFMITDLTMSNTILKSQSAGLITIQFMIFRSWNYIHLHSDTLLHSC